jgi:protein-tyrosine phosphatase
MIFDYTEIIPDRLYIGTFVRPQDVKSLEQMGITTIVNLQSDADIDNYNLSLKKLLEACSLSEIEHRRFPIPDFDLEALSARLPQAVEEVEEVLCASWAKLYVHCTAGINRSPALAAAYLIKTRGLSACEAYDYVTNRRPCNPYLAILEEYEASLGTERNG